MFCTSCRCTTKFHCWLYGAGRFWLTVVMLCPSSVFAPCVFPGGVGRPPGKGLVNSTVGLAVPPGWITCTVLSLCDVVTVNTLPIAELCSTEIGTKNSAYPARSAVLLFRRNAAPSRGANRW